MNALLISAYELGHQPLGLASSAAHLLARGFAVRCLDLSVETLDEESVRRADAIGISIPMHTATRIGLRVADRVRALNPAAPVAFYGLYASLNAEILLARGATAVIGGEFEEPLADWCEAVRDGDPGRAVPGVSVPGRIAAPFLGRTPALVPARDFLPPLSKYARLDDGREFHLAGCVEASRGCAHICTHCPITPVYAGRVRITDPAVVREDIARLVALGARHVTFGDPDFLNAVRHSLDVAHALHDDHPGVTFDVTAKVEHLVEQASVVEELASLGLVFVVSAVESLNDGILRHLAKDHTRADVERALAITRKAGVTLRPSLVSFTPWTTRRDFLDILDFVDDEGLHGQVDPVQMAIRLLVPPGSALLDAEAFAPFRGPLDPERLHHVWTHPDPEMDRLQEAVAAIVERAGETRETPVDTFTRIRAAAGAPSGRPRPAVPAIPPPRLTEAWFC